MIGHTHNISIMPPEMYYSALKLWNTDIWMTNREVFLTDETIVYISTSKDFTKIFIG